MSGPAAGDAAHSAAGHVSVGLLFARGVRRLRATPWRACTLPACRTGAACRLRSARHLRFGFGM